MGPTIILDKCALQSLGREEIWSLSSCFYLNAPPILIQEVIADLKKHKDFMKDPKHEVAVLAEKLRACCGSTFINTHYRHICEGEVLGYKIEMGRRTVVSGGKRVQMPDGSFGVFFDEDPQQAMLRRWEAGNFSGEDEVFAEQWRKASSSLNVEQHLKEARRSAKGLPKPKSMVEVAQFVDGFLKTGQQAHFLRSAMEYLKLPNSVVDRALIRWQIQRHSSLQQFAPYTFFVFRAIQIYSAGLLHGLLSTRPTNALDLEYLFYLPFAEAFCSGDKFVIEMSRPLLAPDQFFIDRDSLKADMKATAAVRNAENEEQRQKLITEFTGGSQPRFAHPFWQKHTKPWERHSPPLDPEVSKKMFKKVQEDFRHMQDALKRGDYS